MKISKFRIPRKKKKYIPKNTFYCYEMISGIIYPEDGGISYYKIKPCKFYNDSKCNILNVEVLDQCKSCGISLGIKYLK